MDSGSPSAGILTGGWSSWTMDERSLLLTSPGHGLELKHTAWVGRDMYIRPDICLQEEISTHNSFTNSLLHKHFHIFSDSFISSAWVPFLPSNGRKSLRRLEVPSSTRKSPYRSRVRTRSSSTSSTLVYATLTCTPSMATGLW
jgi:hypothetical protein